MLTIRKICRSSRSEVIVRAACLRRLTDSYVIWRTSNETNTAGQLGVEESQMGHKVRRAVLCRLLSNKEKRFVGVQVSCGGLGTMVKGRVDE